MTSTTSGPPVNEDEIDLAALVGTILDNKWLICIVTAIFLVVSVGYAFLAAPVYEAVALVQVEQKVPELPGLSALTQTLGASSSQATTEIALITSKTVVGNSATNLNMAVAITPFRFPVFGAFIARHNVPSEPGKVAAPWLGISHDGWGGDELDIFQLKVPDAMLGRHLTLVAGEHGSYKLYAASFFSSTSMLLLDGHVGEVAKGNGVTIQVKNLLANPGMKFDVVRNSDLATIALLQTEIIAAEQGSDSGIILLTYDDPDPKLAANFLDQVSGLYVQMNVDRNSEEAAKSLRFVKEQLPGVRESLEKATAALNVYQQKAGSVDITMQTKGLLDQAVAVETSIQQLRQQQAEAERKYTPEHPAYQALMKQIGQLESEKAGIERQVGKLPDTQQELLRLTRDITVFNTTYTALLGQAQQLEIARAGTVGNVRVVDKATVDTTQPVKPKKLLIIVGGTFLGAFVILVFVFLRQMLHRGVEDPADIEKTGLAVYASVPSSAFERATMQSAKGERGDGAQHLLVLSAPDDRAVEALRSLRTSLHFARLEAKNNILMISGPSPNAGKTFISANLAAVVAQTGQRVLIMDGDLRLGSLHKVIGGKPEGGLSELIAGQIDLAQATRQVANLEKLHFIARGKAPPNPSELLMNERFTALLDRLMPMYDLIIIDTPPILAVTDAAVIGSHAGTSLMVLRFGLNQVREIALANQRFKQNGVDIKGAVFNGVEKRHSGYSSYGYYEYKPAK
jgi:tyrosine-protein kinase Etk/Wzc